MVSRAISGPWTLSSTHGLYIYLLWDFSCAVSSRVWSACFVRYYLWLGASAVKQQQIGDQTAIRHLSGISLRFGVTWWDGGVGGGLTNQRNCLCVNHRANAWNFEHISPPSSSLDLPQGHCDPRVREQELSRIDFDFDFLSGSSTKAKQKADTRSLAALFCERSSWKTSCSSSRPTQSSFFPQLRLLARHLVRHIFTGPPAKRYLFFITVWEALSHTG